VEEGSARRRDLDLTTHNTRKRKTSMPSVGFEPPISANEDPQNLDLHCLQAYMCVCVYIYTYTDTDTHTNVWDTKTRRKGALEENRNRF
jgi:hypothetical protein